MTLSASSHLLIFVLKAFLHKSFSGLSSMNSSTNSESALLSNTSPTQSITKVKHRDNKENKLQRFGGTLVNGGTLVFGKIKSLWSHSNTDIGLNILADSDRLQTSKSKENLGLGSIFLFDLILFFAFACNDDLRVYFTFSCVFVCFRFRHELFFNQEMFMNFLTANFLIQLNR